ncbi:MAG: YmdB family metallophosphoesterase, partial [Nitrospirota bacterium]
MKILFIGDIVGKVGRTCVKNLLNQVKSNFKITHVIANGENAAGGFGINERVAEELFGSGIDLITS